MAALRCHRSRRFIARFKFLGQTKPSWFAFRQGPPLVNVCAAILREPNTKVHGVCEQPREGQETKKGTKDKGQEGSPL